MQVESSGFEADLEVELGASHFIAGDAYSPWVVLKTQPCALIAFDHKVPHKLQH